MTKRVGVSLGGVLGCALSMIHPAMAVDGQWKTTAGDGNWDASTNWVGDPNPVPGGVGSIVQFNTGTFGTVGVTNDTARTVGVLEFGGRGWNLGGSSGITFDNGVDAAELNVASGSASQSFVSNNLVLASDLTVNHQGNALMTLSGSISGAGQLVKNGSGSLRISRRDNTFLGGVILNAGTINLSSTGAGSSHFGSGLLSIHVGGIEVAVAEVISNDYEISNSFVKSGGSLQFSGTGTLTSDVVFNLTNNLSITEELGESGGARSLTLEGTGTLFLSGPAKTYTGGTVLNGGNLTLQAANLLSSAGDVTINSGTFAMGNLAQTANQVFLNGGTLSGSGNSAQYTANSFQLTAGNITNARIVGSGTTITKTGSGTVHINAGASNLNGGLTTISEGTLQLNANDRLSNSSAVLINGGILAIGTLSDTVGALTLTSGSITGSSGVLTSSSYSVASGNISAILGGSGGLTKTTSGVVALSNAQAYTGATTISGGTLLINGSTSAASSVTVNSGGILGGFGTINGSVQINDGGALTPGSSPGNLTVNNSVTIGDGGSFAVEIDGSAVGTDYDRLTLVGGASVFSLTDTNNLQLSLGFVPAGDQMFFIVTGPNAISGIFEQLNGVTTDLSQGSVFSFGGTSWLIGYTGNSVANTFLGGNDLVLQVVPEPSTVALVLLTFVFCLLRRAHLRRSA